MNVSKILKEKDTTLSFEFFPPKTKKSSKNLFRKINELTDLNPSYVSVTYGAGGSARKLTHDLVVKIQEQSNITVVPHLTCVGSSKPEIYSIIEKYCSIDIKNIMALRGDPPKGEEYFVQKKDGFKYAGELVEFIRKNFPHLTIGVAGFPEGHPETPNRLKEMEYLRQKVDKGADYICTQMFFDNSEFYDFRERCRIDGINIPIVAGIMPIVSCSNMRRIADLAAGTKFPALLLKSLKKAKTKKEVQEAGIMWATEQIRDLLNNDVDGVHFYTLNNLKRIRKIYKLLGL